MKRCLPEIFYADIQPRWIYYMSRMHIRMLEAIRSAVHTRAEVLIRSTDTPCSGALRLAIDSAYIAERITSRWHDWLVRRREQWLLDEQAEQELGVTRE